MRELSAGELIMACGNQIQFLSLSLSPADDAPWTGPKRVPRPSEKCMTATAEPRLRRRQLPGDCPCLICETLGFYRHSCPDGRWLMLSQG